MKYTIVSFCAGDYFYDAFNVTVPSWFKPNCEKVVVYTDKEFSYPGVEIRPELPKVSNWIDAVGLKAIVLKKLLNSFEGGAVAYFDMDTYMVSDISGIFDKSFVVAASWIDEQPTASSGIFYAHVLNRVNCPFRRFVNDWVFLQDKLKAQGKGITPHHPAYDQISFTELLHTVDFWNCPGEIWNSRRQLFTGRKISDKTANWKQGCAGAKVLHFVHDSWRDKGFVKEMAKMAGEFNYGNPS